MDDETEVIKQQMADTRESLHAKVEALEHKVLDTVQGATDTVASTVESVSDTVAAVRGGVRDTFYTVRDALDIRHHVEQRPWAMFAGSIALGFLGGYMLLPRRRDPRDRRWPDMTDGGLFSLRSPSGGHGEALPPPQIGTQPAPPRTRPEEKPDWLDQVGEQVKPALDRLRELAIGYTANLVGDLVLHNAPASMRPDLEGVIDQFTSALGGKPMPHEPAPVPAKPASKAAPAGASKPPPQEQHRPVNRISGAHAAATVAGRVSAPVRLSHH